LGTTEIGKLALAVGVPIAFWGTRIAASVIAGLPIASLMPIVFGSLGMIVLALLTTFVPARCATRVDPMVALRYE